MITSPDPKPPSDEPKLRTGMVNERRVGTRRIRESRSDWRWHFTLIIATCGVSANTLHLLWIHFMSRITDGIYIFYSRNMNT